MVLYQHLLTLRLCDIKYIPGFATQVSHGLRREHRFQVSPLMRVRNVLPSNRVVYRVIYYQRVYMLQYELEYK
jgi:hypothetical protein